MPKEMPYLVLLIRENEESGNQCCGGRKMSITRPECVFVALGIQHAMSFVIYGLPVSSAFFHSISYKVQFLTRKY